MSKVMFILQPQPHPSRRMTRFDRLCPKCSVPLKGGLAIQQTWTAGAPDFIGDPSPSLQTMSPGGSGRLIDCLKCPKCGWSMTGAA